MTTNELGKLLGEMYANAGKNNLTVTIHLFGIKYANEIVQNGISTKDIAKSAGINESYGTEIRKGVRLAEYVKLKS